MSQCGMDFRFIPLHIACNSQHFGPIQYVNGLFKSSPTFQLNESKISIDLNDFPSFLESMMQQPPIQLSQLTISFYWNEKFDSTLMDILKKIGIHHWNMLFHCSTTIVIQIILKKIKNCIQYLQFF